MAFTHLVALSTSVLISLLEALFTWMPTITMHRHPVVFVILSAASSETIWSSCPGIEIVNGFPPFSEIDAEPM